MFSGQNANYIITWLLLNGETCYVGLDMTFTIVHVKFQQHRMLGLSSTSIIVRVTLQTHSNIFSFPYKMAWKSVKNWNLIMSLAYTNKLVKSNKDIANIMCYPNVNLCRKNYHFQKLLKESFRGIIKNHQKNALKKLGKFKGWLRTSY